MGFLCTTIPALHARCFGARVPHICPHGEAPFYATMNRARANVGKLLVVGDPPIGR